MSSDTMYLNSSRRLPTAGKNKTSQLQKPERKSTKNHRKNKTRQEGNVVDESVPLSQPQALPNGEKPNFGSSSKKERKSNNQRPDNSYSGSPRNKAATNPCSTTAHAVELTATQAGRKTAELLAKNLKDVVLVESDKGGLTSIPRMDQRTNRQMTPQTLPNASPKQSPLPLPVKDHEMTVHSPLPLLQPGLHLNQNQHPQFQQIRPNQNIPHYQNHSLQPPPMNPQMYQHQNRFPPIIPMGMQHPGPNYSLSSGAPPYFNSMHAPFMTPNAPQTAGFYGIPPPAPPPLSALPGQFSHMNPMFNSNQPMGSVAAIPSSDSNGSEISGPVTLLSREPRASSSSSMTSENTDNRAEPRTEKKHSKKSRGAAKLPRGGYAGASFATNVPAVTNLPKPSFT
ncbi:LAFA_0D01420g1_1 [Lachancea sp. 'fantastica']|nr:LAFA_0D01420g1_1 [Lachancea sp. 'fantastica']